MNRGLKQQLLLFGKVARAPDDDVQRGLTFIPGSLIPTTERYVRKAGRPRHTWARMQLQEATKAAGTYTDLQAKVADEEVWKPLRQGHLLSSKGEGLEELHFEVRAGDR